MSELDDIRWKVRLSLAGGTLCLVIWLATLQIKGSAVFYYLERFALHDDGRYLLASASTLVCLNTLRAVFLYIGWFNLGEGIAYFSPRWKRLSWFIPLLAIPSSYVLLSRVQDGLSLHFGLPALFSIFTFILIQLTTREISYWISRLLIIGLLFFAFQWLDLSPILSRWGLEFLFDERQALGRTGRDVMGVELPVNLPGQLATRGQGNCRLWGEGLAATCAIGRGRVVVLADAALLERDDPSRQGRKALSWLLDAAFVAR